MLSVPDTFYFRGAYLSNIWNMPHDFARACLDCTRRVGARARLHSEIIPVRVVWREGKKRKNVFAATLERAKPRQDCAAQKMTAAVLT